MNDEEEKMASVAVIGRIPFDEEDSVHVFSDVTEEQAIALFRQTLYEEQGDYRTAADFDDEDDQHNEQEIYITAVLGSDSEIDVLYLISC